ncbi:MAG TPA: nucleotide exchange factor GrpE [Solirubrobacteraceae bacterium]|nr:nucleotide exchange factor GrpE [Solirubrobacteraceae bacterium]
MTEIKVTVNGVAGGRSESVRADGASEPSSRAFARDEGSTAPRPGSQQLHASDPGGQQNTPSSDGTPGANSGTNPAYGSARADAARADGPALATSEKDEAAEVEGDLDELVKTARQRDEYLALAQRTQADFENFRKRMAKEAAAALERGAISLAKELLPALDNLDRAMDAAQADDPLLQGVKLVRSELSAALGRAGIESFSPLGEQFDPSLHEAVATAPAPDGQASGTVVEVYQPGYRCRENVIRPARVVVAA